jgi:hypothetical protein
MTSSPSSSRPVRSFRFFLLIAGPLFFLYLATATWTTPYSMDALTNVLAAHEIGTRGDPYLEQYEVLANPKFEGYAAWVVPAKDSAAAEYPPGAALLAAPLYHFWSGPETPYEFIAYDGEAVELPIPSLFPAALVSALVAAVAVGLFALSVRAFATDRVTIVGAYVAGLATGTWTVASDALWQHGPAMMWIAAAGLLSATRQVWSGFAFGAAVLTRPHTAVVAAGNGLWQSWQRRSFRPALKIGLGAAVGLAAVVVYNKMVFGTASISGGYGQRFGERVLSLDLLGYLGNIALALVHPLFGLFVYSPFLLLLVPGLRSAWRAAPAWVRGSAIGGLAYFLLQLKANRYSGGGGFWGYRYSLEALAAWAPLLFLSYTEWIRKHRSSVLQRIFRYLVIFSIEFTLLGAVYVSTLGRALFG